MRTNWNIFTEEVSNKQIVEAESFKDAIQLLLQQKRLKFADLAKELNCTYKHLWSMINGQRNITIEVAFKLQKLTGIHYSVWIDKFFKDFPIDN